MAIGAVIGAVLGIGSSVIQGQQQASAAAKANKLAEKQAKAQYERAEKEWQIDYDTRIANWAWEYAQQEAQIFQEKQQKSDYEWRQGKLIESAMKNLAVNEAALMDKFGTEENLRALQEGMNFGQAMGQLALDSNEQLRQYMQQINDTALQSKALVQQTGRESQELMSSLTLAMQREGLERDIATIATAIDTASAKSRAVARQGGSSSSHRLAMNKAQELGRTYGALRLSEMDRASRVASLNSSMQGERATQMGRFALSVQDSAERMKYTNAKYVQDASFTMNVFKDLTMPTFELANRQGQREMESLYIQTQGAVDEASMPFRESIFFAPRQPIAGLRPEYMAPTKVYQPSGFDLAFNAISAGVQGAMQFSYQKPGGGLGFY